MTTEKKKTQFTPLFALMLLVTIVLPIAVFLYLVLCTDLERYIAIIICLFIPGTIRIRVPENDTSNRTDLRNGIKGMGMILGIVAVLGIIGVLIRIRGTNIEKTLEEKPMVIIAILLAGILYYLIKIYNKKK